MKGKLVKRSNGRFDLYSIEDVDQLNTIASSFDNPKEKLSLKNCQAIENGYDLDELTSKEYLDGYDTTNVCRLAFKDGFQKALELIGNKKFGEFDMRICFYEGKWGDKFESFEPFIHSLQQTEWDVEIVCLHTGDPEHTTNTGLPKLDADGCLILKRL